jgi:hypothetical protein
MVRTIAGNQAVDALIPAPVTVAHA